MIVATPHEYREGDIVELAMLARSGNTEISSNFNSQYVIAQEVTLEDWIRFLAQCNDWDFDETLAIFSNPPTGTRFYRVEEASSG